MLTAREGESARPGRTGIPEFVMICRLTTLIPANQLSPWIQYPLAFADLGFRPRLIVGHADLPISPAITVEETGVEGKRTGDIIREFLWVLRSLGGVPPDIVIANGLWSLLHLYVVFDKLTRPFKRRPSSARNPTKWVLKLDWNGQPYIGESSLKEAVRRLVVSVASHLYDLVTTESTCGVGRISRFPLMNRARLYLMPNGVPFELWPPSRTTTMEGRKNVLCVARIAREKGISDLIKAFSKARPELPGWQLRIAGRVTDVGYFAELQRLVSNLGLENSVVFVGDLRLPELSCEHQLAGIFCLPTNYENIANARIEALAHDIPVITTAAACGRDFAKLGAIVVPTGDERALADSLARVGTDMTGDFIPSRRAWAPLRNYREICVQLAEKLRSGPARPEAIVFRSPDAKATELTHPRSIK